MTHANRVTTSGHANRTSHIASSHIEEEKRSEERCAQDLMRMRTHQSKNSYYRLRGDTFRAGPPKKPTIEDDQRLQRLAANTTQNEEAQLLAESVSYLPSTRSSDFDRVPSIHVFFSHHWLLLSFLTELKVSSSCVSNILRNRNQSQREPANCKEQ